MRSPFEKMNVRTTLGILAVFALSLSMTAFGGILSAHAQTAPAPGSTSATFFTPSGPASDAIQMNIYAGEQSESSALQSHSIDLMDVPLKASQMPNFCPSTQTSFYCTGINTAEPQYGQFEIEFNHANTFFGITDCFAQDNIVNGGSCTVSGGNAPGNVPTVATCLTSTVSRDNLNCSQEMIDFRQGVAHLLDKQAMINTLFTEPAPFTGTLGIALDNPLPPPDGQPHSGLPCDGNQAGATGTCGSGSWASYTATTNHATFTIGGVCSWDTIDKTCVTAFSHSGLGSGSTGSADGFTYVVGSPDFVDAGKHWVAAGLASAQNPDGTLCEAAPGSCFDTALQNANNPINFIIRIDDPHRLAIGQNLAKAMCELFGSTTATPTNPSTSCSNLITPSLETIGQAFFTVFATAACPGASNTNSCPNTSWNMYTGGFSLNEEYNQIWALYSQQFASDFCTTAAADAIPNTVIGNDNYFCNARMNTYANWVQRSSTFANATANLQIANDLFGNHTATVSLYDLNSVYGYSTGWTGVSDATGFGISQANFMSLLNAWSSTGGVSGPGSGPTIVWGQKGSPSTYNPYQLGTVIEADLAQEVYDSPIVVAPYFPQAGANAGTPFLLSWMVDSYSLVTHATDSNCPTSVTNPGHGVFPILQCLKFTLRGDIFWHDGQQVTLSDVKFTEESLNVTGSLFSTGTVDTGDVVYSTSVLPKALGGTENVGQSEVGYIALTIPSVFAIEDLASVPILPQHVWALDGTKPCTAEGSAQCDIFDSPAFAEDPVTIGQQASMVGSGAFVCASGPLGAAGTVIGQGCTSSGSSSVPAGGTTLIRRFGSGLTPANLAYFRNNANYAQWQWADFDGATSVDGSDIASASLCLSSTPPLTGACLHFDNPARTLTTTSGAGNAIGQNSGGDNDGLVTSFEFSQIKRWFGTSWTDPTPYATLSTAEPNGGGAQPACGTVSGSDAGSCAGLYDDGTVYSTPPPPP